MTTVFIIFNIHSVRVPQDNINNLHKGRIDLYHGPYKWIIC